MNQRLHEFLTARQARYETVEHAAAVTAQEQAAALHVSGHAFATVLVVKGRDGFVMVVVPALVAAGGVARPCRPRARAPAVRRAKR
jgi:hypothetical protein